MLKKLIILLIISLSIPLLGFKVKTHVAIGRKIISETKEGIYKDGFPDIFTGQMATHVSNFENVKYNGGDIEKHKVLEHTCDKFQVNDSFTTEHQDCLEVY
jgi:hypothetical protein